MVNINIKKNICNKTVVLFYVFYECGFCYIFSEFEIGIAHTKGSNDGDCKGGI